MNKCWTNSLPRLACSLLSSPQWLTFYLASNWSLENWRDDMPMPSSSPSSSPTSSIPPHTMATASPPHLVPTSSSSTLSVPPHVMTTPRPRLTLVSPSATSSIPPHVMTTAPSPPIVLTTSSFPPHWHTMTTTAYANSERHHLIHLTPISGIEPRYRRNTKGWVSSGRLT